MLVMGIAVLGFMTMSAQAGTIDLIVNAYATYNDVVTPIPTKCGDLAPVGVEPGSIITYEIAVAVDPDAGHALGNMGLALIVFDVTKCGSWDGISTLTEVTPAESGYNQTSPTGIGPLKTIMDYQYVNSGSSLYPGYNGGWGFDNAGLPSGGNVTSSPGDVKGAGSSVPLSWIADTTPAYPGNQNKARLGVGIGDYYFGDDDPVLSGLKGGFGQEITNQANIVEGDGHWIMFRGTMDTSAWLTGMNYGWDVTPKNGAVFTPTLDYNVDQGAGFRIAVYEQDMDGDSFEFFLVPEPASLGLLLVGGLALIRRRR
jgi:hypothetical protein